MKKITIAIMALLAVVSVATSSCSDDDNAPAQAILQEFVTVVGNKPTYTEFQYTVNGAQERLVTLTAELNAADRQMIDSIFTPGTRAYMSYMYVGQGVVGYSGPISLYTLSKCYTDTVSAVPAADCPLDLTGYSTTSVVRSGNYINLIFAAEKEDARRSFEVVVSEETENAEMPDVYISTSVKDGSLTYVQRQYASFDMTPLFTKPGIKGVKVHVANDQNPYQKTFELKL